MLKFGIIAEGPTDHQVIENILLGYFQDQEEEPVIIQVQPPPPILGTQPPPGGWSLVFKSLDRKDHEGALQFGSDYLVIHIDTDVQEELGFDVPRREGGKELSLPDRVARVIDKIKSHIDPAFFEANKQRFLFAIAVDAIECWLLPLLFDDKKKAKKTTGCLVAADRELRRRENPPLSAEGSKSVAAYDMASRGYLKRKELLGVRDANPSLGLFIDQLDALPSSGSSSFAAN